MADISILDLQNLRHLIGGYDTTHCAASLHRSRRGGFLCLKTSPILTYIQFFSKISNFSYNPKNSLLS